MSFRAVASSDSGQKSTGGLTHDRHRHKALEGTPCLSVCSRKMGIILFTCRLRSWLRCLIHVRSLAGDSWMNDAI